LFEGDERTQLIAAFRESFSQREGLILDMDDELWRRFTRCIQRNLHVIFTMNPASSDFENRCTASPALFNRCVVDWFGKLFNVLTLLIDNNINLASYE
jgi:dynein heavy chain 1